MTAIAAGRKIAAGMTYTGCVKNPAGWRSTILPVRQAGRTFGIGAFSHPFHDLEYIPANGTLVIIKQHVIIVS